MATRGDWRHDAIGFYVALVFVHAAAAAEAAIYLAGQQTAAASESVLKLVGRRHSCYTARSTLYTAAIRRSRRLSASSAVTSPRKCREASCIQGGSEKNAHIYISIVIVLQLLKSEQNGFIHSFMHSFIRSFVSLMTFRKKKPYISMKTVTPCTSALRT